MNNEVVNLRETWYVAETIDEEGVYKKLKYKKVENIAFYIRVLGEWFHPCKKCQQKLKKMLSEGKWTLGNKQYDPPIELNNTRDEVDDDSFTTLEEHKATKEEIDRIGMEGWENLGKLK